MSKSRSFEPPISIVELIYGAFALMCILIAIRTVVHQQRAKNDAGGASTSIKQTK